MGAKYNNLSDPSFLSEHFNTCSYVQLYGKHSLRYLGPKLWNNLSPTIRNRTSQKNLTDIMGLTSVLAVCYMNDDCIIYITHT